MAAVRGHAVGWQQGIRSGDHVLLVDDRDAGALVEQGLGAARRLVVATAPGRARVAPAPRLTDALMLALMLAALLFALLGVAIHRWASDPGVGAIFLVFSGSSATALAVIPGALMGSAWAYFLAATAATIAPPALSAVVLWFPRPLRWARPILGLLAALTVCLVVPIVAVLAQGAGMSPLLDDLLFAWLAGNLLAGAGLLAARTIGSADRHTLAPIAIGVGLGAAPMALLTALPQAIGRAAILPVELAAVGAAAIPLAFGYAIARHHLFALDAQLRGLLVRICAAAATLSLFVVGWLGLRSIGLDNDLAVLIAVAATALAGPFGIFATTRTLAPPRPSRVSRSTSRMNVASIAAT